MLAELVFIKQICIRRNYLLQTLSQTILTLPRIDSTQAQRQVLLRETIRERQLKFQGDHSSAKEDIPKSNLVWHSG